MHLMFWGCLVRINWGKSYEETFSKKSGFELKVGETCSISFMQELAVRFLVLWVYQSGDLSWSYEKLLTGESFIRYFFFFFFFLWNLLPGHSEAGLPRGGGLWGAPSRAGPHQPGPTQGAECLATEQGWGAGWGQPQPCGMRHLCGTGQGQDGMWGHRGRSRSGLVRGNGVRYSYGMAGQGCGDGVGHQPSWCFSSWSLNTAVHVISHPGPVSHRNVWVLCLPFHINKCLFILSNYHCQWSLQFNVQHQFFALSAR